MQEKQKKAIRWISLVLIALTALIVWRVNYEIEFMMDDEWYSTVLYADTPIRNLSDIIRAQIWHYFNWGGRSMAHALLQLILLAGEHWADILNTGMTLLLGWLACMIADRRKLPYWFAALGMILGLNANWKMSMFWEAGAANYLYMAGFLLAFLFCYLKYEEKNLPGIVIWILPLGLIAGWSNENMGPAVWLLSLLVILLRHREHKKAPVWMYLGNISCLAGTILMIAAPGNFVRSGETGGRSLQPAVENVSALLRRSEGNYGVSVPCPAAYGICTDRLQRHSERKPGQKYSAVIAGGTVVLGCHDPVPTLSGSGGFRNDGFVDLCDFIHDGKNRRQAERKCLDVLWLCRAGMAAGHVFSGGIPGIMLGMDQISE